MKFPARAAGAGERGKVVPYVAGSTPVAVGDMLVVCISKPPHLEIWTAWPVFEVADDEAQVFGGPNHKTVMASDLLSGRESLLFRRDDHDPARFKRLWFKGWTSELRAVHAFAEVAL
ncbi:hypothetical protein [Brevundimonas sp.]|uniref:hypothetical protein n=1 Tax=Brevundimonas sp. TaxID=1871086 RepID=UPI0028A24FCA|nr:hypothetical protein [Brevundimonas sp.]